MLSNKIKSLLTSADIKPTDATVLNALGGINAQSLTNKYNRNSFSVSDMVKLAELCGYTLCFTNGSNTITIVPDDVNEPKLREKTKKPED